LIGRNEIPQWPGLSRMGRQSLTETSNWPDYSRASVRLESVGVLERPDIRTLLAASVERAKTPFSPTARHQLIIRSVSAKQRPRRRS
jgi:hypothetical protein